MTSRTAPVRHLLPVLVAASVTLGSLGCLWVLWFLSLLVFSAEGAVPPKWRIPDVPAGASVIDASKKCGSGGCWWHLTVAPAAGQSPEDLAHVMGLAEEQRRPPALLDPGFVYLGAEPAEDRLLLHVGYR